MMNESPATYISTLYRFCAQSMRYPESQWFTQEYLDNLYTLLDAVGKDQEKKKLVSFFTSTASFLECLQIDYTRLFITGVPHVLAPPYGSVYIDKSLQGQHTAKTLKFYHDHGFAMAADADLPDHIIHQLEFLSLLADDNDQQAEHEFLVNIFLSWFQHFAKKVQCAAGYPLYPAVVQLIAYLTKEENEYGIHNNEA
jgi:putative dimethyl sulfoxide reductase chaperone